MLGRLEAVWEGELGEVNAELGRLGVEGIVGRGVVDLAGGELGEVNGQLREMGLEGIVAGLRGEA